MARVSTKYVAHKQPLSYEVLPNGYDIYMGETLWITQHEPHIPNRNLSYEENAIAQMEEIVNGLKYAEASQNTTE